MIMSKVTFLKEIKNIQKVNFSNGKFIEGLILLKVFTYSCMNCLRSMKYIKRIYTKYKRYGLQLIILHPYEFEFERDIKGIKGAMKKSGIGFPVIIDKDRKLIKKLGVNFWPTDILIKSNRIVYSHIGEGDYKKLEKVIRMELNVNTNLIFTKEPAYSRIPAVYCGSKKKGIIYPIETRNKRFGVIYADKNWKQDSEYLRAYNSGRKSLVIITKGNSINMTAQGLNNNPVSIKVISNSISKKFIIKKPKMYLLSKRKKSRQLKILTSSDNLAIYSFTFD